MSTGQLIENSFAITTHSIKKDLHKARRKEQVGGYLNVLNNSRPSIADYHIQYEDEKTYFVIALGIDPQRILLSNQKLNFGNRTYLTCKCERKTNALYLNNGVFACRTCQKLRYQSTTINRTTKHGYYVWQQSRILKLINTRENIGRIFYKSQYTKRFTRWLNLAICAGLMDEVIDAKKLMMAINAQQQ